MNDQESESPGILGANDTPESRALANDAACWVQAKRYEHVMSERPEDDNHAPWHAITLYRTSLTKPRNEILSDLVDVSIKMLDVIRQLTEASDATRITIDEISEATQRLAVKARQVLT